jgi:hypothetical protein
MHMVIDNAGSDVNGTRVLVECSSGGRVHVVSTDIINVIGNGEYKLDTTKLKARVLPVSELHAIHVQALGEE